MITIQKYVRAQSLEEAGQLNQNKRNRILGGMLWLRLGKGSVGTAIDLCDLGLNTIEETEAQFSIGAMATLRDLETHEGLNVYSGGAVAGAVKDIVGGELTTAEKSMIESDHFQTAIDAVLYGSDTNVSTNSLKLAEARIGKNFQNSLNSDRIVI